MTIKKHLKKNWDIYTAYILFILSIPIAFGLASGCNGWDYLIIDIVVIIGYLISSISIVIAFYKQFTVKNISKLRIISEVIFLIPLFYFLIKYTGGF